jgi:hypothetical protein
MLQNLNLIAEEEEVIVLSDDEGENAPSWRTGRC